MLTFLGLGYFATPNLPKKVFLFNPLIDFKKGVGQGRWRLGKRRISV